jgi:hypothetical protein
MKIEWNRVTWYSKLLAIILFVGVIFAGYVLGSKKSKIEVNESVVNPPVKDITVLPTLPVLSKDGKYCFSRNQIATKTEPSNEKENIDINIKDDVVTGTKTGTQNGPELTNGYFGDLNGNIKDNILTLTYSYTVEGASNKELEVYELTDNSLTKMRWPLMEGKGILLPDKSKAELSSILYGEYKCSM